MPGGLNPQSAATVGPIIREKISAGESVWLTVTGRSMTPTFINGRDAVLLQPIVHWPPSRGTVLFIQREDGGYVLHRVIHITGDSVVLNGDGQLWMEGPIGQELAIAQVGMFRRRGKFYSVELKLFRVYSGFWMALRPLRRHVFGLYRKIKGIFRK